MARNLDHLQRRERLLVGRRFLLLRPWIAAFGAAGNATLFAASGASPVQRAALAGAVAGTVGVFFLEAAWLRRRPLSERWLFNSLALTLVALAAGSTLAGGLSSPLLPLFFAPVVVGFAAFARTRWSALLFGLALAALAMLAVATPLSGFPAPAAPWSARMLFVSAVTALALLAVGVIGLVDAHAEVARDLERMRKDVLEEARRRELSVERLGAAVAHDVKNPLTAVRGLAQLALRSTALERDQKRLSVVVEEVDRALALLQDYLSFAKPLGDLSIEDVDVRALFGDLSALIEARAAERGVGVAVSGDALVVSADQSRLKDALLNLALNALAAMPEGGMLSLSASGDDGKVRICVSDDGAGMSAEALERLGRPFASESTGGTGLGVLLARAVARQHGGELSVESAPGKGTRAVLELPRRASYEA